MDGQDMSSSQNPELMSSYPSGQEVTKSPYEYDYDAERGEKIFHDMKEALKGDVDDIPTQRAVQMFGPTNANCLVQVASMINKSGIAYSGDWSIGKIRGSKVGDFPLSLLLICLVPSRFVRADDSLLSKLCKDTDLHDHVNQAIDEWGLYKDYTRVRASSKSYQFKAKKRDCFKCAIFVARLFCCMKHCGISELSNSLLKKVKGCLAIMEKQIQTETNNRKKKVKNSAAIPPLVSVSTGDRSASYQTPTRRCFSKPKKAPESTTAPPAAIPVTNEKKRTAAPPAAIPVTNEKKRKPEDDDDDYDSDVVVLETNVPSQKRRASRSGTSAVSLASSISGSTPSIQCLILRFEEQYEEMGKRYEEMGNILQQMKESAASGRSQTEEEIRADLLKEVQRNIMDSLPKK